MPRYHFISASLLVSSELFATFYYANSNFKTYNLFYGHDPDAKLPDIDDETPVTGNLRVVQYHCTGSGTSRPDTYTGPRMLLQPLQLEWDATLQLWKVTFRTVGFSGFFVTGQSDDALPVTLLSFKAEKQENNVQLSWETAEEKDFSHFEVERSSDGRSFIRIGRVSESESSDNTRWYTYTDSPRGVGLVYYRLKMIDLDGSVSYSAIEAVDLGEAATLMHIFPNPSRKGIVKLETGSLRLHDIGVYDLTGRKTPVHVIRIKGISRESHERDFEGVAAGVYLIVVSYDSGVINKKQVVY